MLTILSFDHNIPSVKFYILLLYCIHIQTVLLRLFDLISYFSWPLTILSVHLVMFLMWCPKWHCLFYCFKFLFTFPLINLSYGLFISWLKLLFFLVISHNIFYHFSCMWFVIPISSLVFLEFHILANLFSSLFWYNVFNYFTKYVCIFIFFVMSLL